MNIVTVNVGQGALAIVRHQKEAIIVDCRIPASSDRTVAYVKEVMALALRDRYVKGLVLTVLPAGLRRGVPRPVRSLENS